MRWILGILACATAVAAGLLISCSSTGSTGGMGTVKVMLSDPATCQAPSGPFSHVYVTITDVKASTNADAGSTDSSWVDLTPGLSSQPKQIDLLGQANNQCFLASLGSTQQLQAGNYQQIRVLLATNSTSVVNNACTSSANCVVLSGGTIVPLQLSSEAQTGIKIPSGQIASGGFSIASGQTKDLDIDFNTCVSIVAEGNGAYRLKPVLHAGEVTTTSTSINGTVVDKATNKPIGGSVMVALEQKDSNGIDRIYMSTLADASGGFVFCPLPAGTYDVVIVAESSGAIAYAPAVITGVSPGQTVSAVQLTAAAAPATLSGTVTTAGSAGGTGADIQLSWLEAASSTLTVTVPLLPNTTQSTAMLALTTASGSSCASGTDCATYTSQMPAAALYLGAYASSGGIMLTQAASVGYTADAMAFVPSSGGTADCSPSEVKSTAAVTPVSGSTTNVATLAFTGCQ